MLILKDGTLMLNNGWQSKLNEIKFNCKKTICHYQINLEDIQLGYVFVTSMPLFNNWVLNTSKCNMCFEGYRKLQNFRIRKKLFFHVIMLFFTNGQRMYKIIF